MTLKVLLLICLISTQQSCNAIFSASFFNLKANAWNKFLDLIDAKAAFLEALVTSIANKFKNIFLPPDSTGRMNTTQMAASTASAPINASMGMPMSPAEVTSPPTPGMMLMPVNPSPSTTGVASTSSPSAANMTESMSTSPSSPTATANNAAMAGAANNSGMNPMGNNSAPGSTPSLTTAAMTSMNDTTVTVSTAASAETTTSKAPMVMSQQNDTMGKNNTMGTPGAGAMTGPSGP